MSLRFSLLGFNSSSPRSHLLQEVQRLLEREMGCNSSKLDDEEAVQLCKDRKKFIKQAVEHRLRFAAGHLAYIQSLKRVSAALRDYIEGDEPREFLLDSFITPPFTPVKKSTPRFITISPKCLQETPTIQSESNTSMKISYYRPSGNPPVSVEERPQSPETVRIQNYSSMYNYGIDGFFTMQSPSLNPSSYSYSPNNRPNIPPPSPQTNQWDFFWNPFSSLDYYGYPTRSNLEQSVIDDDINGLRQVREEEGIPDLEEETEHEELDSTSTHSHSNKELQLPRVLHVTVEDVDEDEDMTSADESENEVNGIQSHGNESVELSQPAQQVEIHRHENAVGECDAKEETPGFTVYVNRRPTSMDEVIKDLEKQFAIVCNSAKEVSALLDSSHAQYLPTSHENSPMKMLNPVALFRSGSSRSSSSRHLVSSSSSRDEGYESSSDFSAESCMFSGSHQSTLDRLYAWEKRLYEEVRSGERVRLAYEKKCKQLRNQDFKGEDPNSADKSRAAIRDLHTQIKVAIHSIEAISKRIDTLRDEELHPQLLELIQGLARMWKVMAECHQMQKRTLDDAKLLLAGTPSKLNKSRRHSAMSATTIDPNRLTRSASKLESELRNWKACFEIWVTSQRSYVQCLAGWLLRCMGCEPDTSKLPFSPLHSSAVKSAPPIFGLCIQWSRFMDALHEVPVLDGLDFFAAGMGSIYAQQAREDSRRAHQGSSGSKRFSGGMSVAVSSLTEFAICSAEGYAELVNQWEKVKWPPLSSNVEDGNESKL
ncbi:LOW QUALITY PROTEIN: hypothetical protein V2J09_009613 [Rumex salicifolius]